ncbi:class I adenylate-forming enzyme family protein [Peptostreptococcus equinus]|uniref:Class I adenylate-forming enzyme family protein n=1 Tax=Peptostreptococcus equinus TaxID=3003601 RepID=A0ABY7JTT9_9FIRM|nr:class I adenylate-forming enzyme family protein [Peptostreptococcus sp. CBA3647]WAW15332.1 class I adenylate-forming enzyme family protein [Peptostreptococcus sp. CBA3647]
MELVKTTLYQCFVDRAKESPHKLFIENGEESFTWENVNNITNKLSVLLYEQGVRKGSRVGLYGTNSASWIIAFLAIQKIGASAVLINSCYRINELVNCIDIADIQYILYTRSCECSMYDETINKLRLMRKYKHVKCFNIEHSYKEWMKIEEKTIKHAFNNIEFEKSDSHDISCVLFTSGTTNNCKGVLLSHYSLINNARQVIEEMKWSQDDIMCLVVPLFHCFGVSVSLLTSIIVGMKIQLLEKYSTIEVCKSIEEYKCTVLNGVPSMFLALVRNPRMQEFDLSTLKTGIIAGSPIYKEEYLEICNKLPSLNLQTSYGLTEASPCVTIAKFDDSIEKKSISAGKVIDNVEVKILDSNTFEECGPNVIGEIFVRGYNVTKGYLTNDPVVCDAVMPNGCLKTGDLGYLDSDNYLYIVGRRKNMIIRGGENISPYEIEEYIKKVDSRLNVLVFGIKSEVLQEEIVATIEGKDNSELVAKIKNELNNSISKYKIPKFIVFIETFPKTSTGKIDEKELKRLVNEKLK